MADKFSLDDILAEVEQKKSSRPEKSSKKDNISITDILSEEVKIKGEHKEKAPEPVREKKPAEVLKAVEPEVKTEPAHMAEKPVEEVAVAKPHAVEAEKQVEPVHKTEKASVEKPRAQAEKKRVETEEKKPFAPHVPMQEKRPWDEPEATSEITAFKPHSKNSKHVSDSTETFELEEEQPKRNSKPIKLTKRVEEDFSFVTESEAEDDEPTPRKKRGLFGSKDKKKPVVTGVEFEETETVKQPETAPKAPQPIKIQEEKQPAKQEVGVTQILTGIDKKKMPYKPESVTQILSGIPDAYDEKEELLSTGSIEIDENDVMPEKLFTKPEKDKHKKKRKSVNPEDRKKLLMTMQLEKEEAFEDPDDLIDAINPYEVKSKAVTDFDDDFFVGGDTMGLAGNDLKELAGAGENRDTLEIEDATRPVGDTREQMMANTQENLKTYEPKNHAKTEKEKRSNTALIESLNKAIAKKHEEEQTVIMKPNITGTLGSITPPENGLNIDYGGKVIPQTGTIGDLSQEFEAADKKKKKLRDFVLEDGQDDSDEDDGNDVEFDSYDTTGQIWEDLCESHKGLRTRFIILLIITVIMFLVTLMGDLRYNLDFSIFGIHIGFLNKIADPQGFVFFNLIFGVIGAALCSSVVMNGIIKIFKGRADCDSICSLVTVFSLLSTIMFLMDFNYLQMGRAYLYVPVAMSALLFNTLGKMMMIVRAKRNFRFISGDTTKYSAMLVQDDATASAFTKGVVKEIPCLAAMRKTEFLTDFLKNSYCEDKADRICKLLTPVSFLAALVFAALAYFVPNGVEGMQNNLHWAVTVAIGTLGIMSPFSMMFVVNYPLSRAGKALAKTDSAVLGYTAVEEFSETNAVVVDAATLFPQGTVVYSNIKHLSQPNSINNIALDQAIILAASLAIKSGSVLSHMFRDMINDKEEILAKIDNCVYEDNMGILGWFGNKRMIMGNREQMKHHDIKIPDMEKVRKYSTDTNDTLYLAVGGEIVIMFFVQLMANAEIKSKLQKLEKKGVSLIVKTTDSIVTIARLAEIFEIDPEMIKILPYSMHEQFNNVTKYVSRGDGAVSCSGTFTSLASALLAAKSLVKDIGLGCGIMLSGIALGALCAAALGAFAQTGMLTPSMIIGWNSAWCVAALIAESIRKY